MAVAAPPRPPPVEVDDGVIEEARRRQRRRRLGILCLLVASAIVGAAIGLTMGGGGSTLTRRSGGRHLRPSAPVRGQRGSAPARAGRPYLTSVDPGDGIQLASARLGFALSWEPTNGFDDNLASPAGTISSWPSPSVLVTRDGGRRWTRSLSASGGFWGLSAASPDRVWAVGVSGLYRTTTGGISWQRAGEPADPLVRVAFTSSTAGVGLTSRGRLVVSGNAGQSWRLARWSGRGAALCVSSGAVLLADQSGAIWRSTNSGASWQRTAPTIRLFPPYGKPEVDDLSCDGANADQFWQTFGQAGPGGFLSQVRQSIDGGRTWRRISAQTALGEHVETVPVSAAGYQLERAAPFGAHGLCLVGYRLAPGAIGVECRNELGRRFHRASVPPLPFAGDHPTVVIQGIDFLAHGSGWLAIDVTNSAQAPRTSAITELWKTQDGGVTWQVAYATPTYHGVWCSRLHTSVCWRPVIS